MTDWYLAQPLSQPSGPFKRKSNTTWLPPKFIRGLRKKWIMGRVLFLGKSWRKFSSTWWGNFTKCLQLSKNPGVIFRDSTYTYVQHVVMSEALCPKHTTCERFYILAKDFGVYSMQHHNSCYYQGGRKEGAAFHCLLMTTCCTKYMSNPEK